MYRSICKSPTNISEFCISLSSLTRTVEFSFFARFPRWGFIIVPLPFMKLKGLKRRIIKYLFLGQCTCTLDSPLSSNESATGFVLMILMYEMTQASSPHASTTLCASSSKVTPILPGYVPTGWWTRAHRHSQFAYDYLWFQGLVILLILFPTIRSYIHLVQIFCPWWSSSVYRVYTIAEALTSDAENEQ